MPKLRAPRWVLSAIGGLLVFSTVYAFAATLNVTSNNLSSGTQTLASCDTDGVNASYTVVYDSGIPGYKVDDLTVSGVAGACDGKDFSVTLGDSSNVALGTVSPAAATLSGTGDTRILTFDFVSSNVSAATVQKVFVTITD